MRFLVSLVLVLAASPAISSPATIPSTPATRVERLLAGYHGLPSRGQLQAAGAPDTAKILRQIAGDSSRFTATRAAAFEALKRWPDARTLAAYGAALNDPQTPMGLRHKLLRYVVVFDAQALELLRAAQGDPDVQIRLTAAQALFDLVTPEADKALREALRTEPEPMVRTALMELLARRAMIR